MGSGNAGEFFHTSQALANAARQARERNFADLYIVDADFHHYETSSWAEIIKYIDDDVIRQISQAGAESGRSSLFSLINDQPPANQSLGGRIQRYIVRNKEVVEESRLPKDVVVMRRALDAMGINCAIVFPTYMLNLGLHPQVEVETSVARAYARWMTEEILPADDAIKTMLYLPFNDPVASAQLIRDFGESKGVVGFMVTSARYRPVHHNDYMGIYADLQERNLPLAFHSAWNWYERSLEQLNKFISVHALGRSLSNMVHLTNMVINGIPERFPQLKLLWIESGLAWIPFLMQRLDLEYLMRSSEAPLLTRKPSEYIREMYFTQQPMEFPDDLGILEQTFNMIHAETQLLFASDWPHWDFDLPSRIYDLPFLSDHAKRRILGENARALFRLDGQP